MGLRVRSFFLPAELASRASLSAGPEPPPAAANREQRGMPPCSDSPRQKKASDSEPLEKEEAGSGKLKKIITQTIIL